MSTWEIVLRVLEGLLTWGGRLARALRKGDEDEVDEVLRDQPRFDAEWARFQRAKAEKFDGE